MDNSKKGNLLQSYFLLLTEQLLIFPVSFTVLKLIGIRPEGIYCFFLISSFVLMLVSSHLTSLRRPLVVLIYAGIMLAFSYFWLPMNWKALLIFAFGIFIEIRALSLIDQPYNSFSLYSFVYIGFFGYILAAIFYNRDDFEPYMGILAFCATFAAIFTCICMNMAIIGYEKSVGNRTGNIPRLSKKSNRTMLAAFIILLLVFTALGFADRIYAFLGFIIGIVFAFFNMLFSSLYTVPEGVPGNDQAPPFSAEEATTSPFWMIVEEIIKILAVVLFIAAIIYAFYLLFRYLKKHYHEILMKLWNRVSNVIRTFLFGKGKSDLSDLGYEDEMTSLMKKNESLLGATRRWLKSHSREARPYGLLTDNDKKARWLYSRIVQKQIKKGLALNRTMTPKQILRAAGKDKAKNSDDLNKAISCYNNARYGNEPADNEGVDALKSIYRNP